MDQSTEKKIYTFWEIVDLLLRHGENGCSSDGDVRACLREAGIDTAWLQRELLLTSLYPDRCDKAERPSAAILWLLTQADQEEVGSGFLKWLGIASGAIETELADAGPLEGHAIGCIRAAIAKAFQFVTQNGRGLPELTAGMRVIVQGEVLQLPFGDPVSMVEHLPGLARRGFDLWLFRSSIAEGRQDFDGLVARHWRAIAGDVTTNLPRLFDGDVPSGLRTIDCVTAFAPALSDAGMLDALLSEIVRRAGASNGFSSASELVEWLETAARFKCWESRHMGIVTTWEVGADKASHAYFDILMAAVRSAWERDRETGSYGALTLALRARRHASGLGTLESAEVRDRCLALIRDLPKGDQLAWLIDRLSDVPSRLDRQQVPWNYLPPLGKAHWRGEISKRLVDQPELRRGLTRYFLEWSGRADYDDMEPLLKEFVLIDDDLSLLRELGKDMSGLAGIRASCLYKFMLTNPPFLNREIEKLMRDGG